MGRNTPLLEEIVKILPLSDKADALTRLEHHFHNRLVVEAGSVDLVATLAASIRLRIDRHECSVVLDEIASRRLVVVSLDMVEEVVNDLFVDRVIEP